MSENPKRSRGKKNPIASTGGARNPAPHRNNANEAANEELKKQLNRFKNTKREAVLALPNLNKSQLEFVHRVASQTGLDVRSEGNEKSCVLYVTRKPPNHSSDYLSRREREALRKKLVDFVYHGETQLALPNLSSVERQFLHKCAAHMGLKTKSEGSKNNRVLHITHRKRNPQLGEAKRLILDADAAAALELYEERIEEKESIAKSVVKQSTNHTNGWSTPRKLHSAAALQDALGPRMVPPHPHRVRSDLAKAKKLLPIYQYKGKIEDMLNTSSIFIISGETGSGKTTQVPQYILNQATRAGQPCRILVTQPRRVAAVSVASRVAEERGEELGKSVGFQIRLDACVSSNTNLIYTTSGCLLRAIMADSKALFAKITHLIIDEIHERDKFTDFSLIAIKEQLKVNPDLKVILMSATMDIIALSNYFDCPVLTVPGQSYDVKIYHLDEILYETNYRTPRMEICLANKPSNSKLMACQVMKEKLEQKAPQIADEFLQQVVDTTIGELQNDRKTKEEIQNLFDQLRYYVECENLPVDAAQSHSGLTPLMMACKLNLPEIVGYFVEHSANICLRDAKGRSALDFAASHKDGTCKAMLKGLENKKEHQALLKQENAEKQLILDAYEEQFNGELNAVDHDLITTLVEGLTRRGSPGSILVFLPGYSDIVIQSRNLSDTLRHGTYRLCTLHGQMDSKDQVDVLRPTRERKVILSTNIGQTSITIPDLVYVIDSGKVKMNTYDSITESSQLNSVWISQADANQRAGRAGRTQNGVCYRLFSHAKFQNMPKFCVPEFMRIPLTEICLFAKTLEPKMPVYEYLQRALDPPTKLSVQNAVKKLRAIGVFNEDESVTELGQHLVGIPMDVHLGKALLYSIFLRCFDNILTIVAFHSVKDPFMLPNDPELQSQANQQRREFAGHSFSDHMAILQLHKQYLKERNRNNGNEFLKSHFLSQTGMNLFLETRRQLRHHLVKRYKLTDADINVNGDNWHILRFSLAAGFYPNLVYVDRKDMTLVSGTDKTLAIQRQSALCRGGKEYHFLKKFPHDWIIYFEKSRKGRSCCLNMNTNMPAEIIALACGLQCDLLQDSKRGDDESGEEDGSDNDSVDSTKENVPNALQDLKVKNVDGISENSNVVLSLDNAIKFEMLPHDAKRLYLLRSMIHTEFQAFLLNSRGPNRFTYFAGKMLQMFFDTMKEAGLQEACDGEPCK